MKYAIGMDIGGTKIRTGLVKKDKIIKIIEFHTGRNKKDIMKKIIESIEFVSEDVKKRKISGIGIGVPGIIDKKNGVVVNLPNIPGFKNIKLKKILQDKFDLKVSLGNDASLYTLGESIYGAGRNKENVVCLTIGTGLGGGIVIDKRIYGGSGSAGEFGHMIIIKDGLKCKCGSKGCLEEYVSTRAIRKYSKRVFGKEIDPLEIENMARKGNKRAKKVYRIMGEYLGIGLVNINNVLNPDVIVIGGGISHSGGMLLNPARKILNNISLVKPSLVVQSKLKRNSGVVGAAYLISEKVF